MKARDVMTHGVVTIAPEASIAQAIARMISHGVSGMPVVDDAGTLVGMITEGDFLRRIETDTVKPRRRLLEALLGSSAEAEDYVRSHGRAVRHVMSSSVVTVNPDTPLPEVVRVMEENDVKRVPVTDGGRVVGIVSRSDLMSAVADCLGALEAHPAGDRAIRASIMAELKRQTWAPLHAVKVLVRDGVVFLQGIIYDERQRRALQVLVENIDGVREVRDELTCVEPLSGTVTTTSP